jgi:uncharacterized protein YndB with AHSA1/START domain
MLMRKKIAIVMRTMNKKITVETIINAPIEKVWEYWTEPQHITKWCHASDDWEAPSAENDLRTGGSFKTVMAAKDGNASFDFTGKYTEVSHLHTISYAMDDGRRVNISFVKDEDGVKVIETFDPEEENSEEMQRQGWQAILENFKKYVEKT